MVPALDGTEALMAPALSSMGTGRFTAHELR
jgi:hypothetical protein